MVSEQERLGRVGTVLIKYGFEDAVKELLPLLTRFRLRSLKPEIRGGSPYTRLRLALSELGPTFIKFGQFMRTRPDLLPPDLVKELKLLPDNVEPLPFEEINKIIEKEFGPVRKGIKSIEEKPFSSGSLSQKHLAKLENDTLVVLKIQRPDVRDIIDADLKILRTIAINAEKVFSDLLIFDFPAVVDDFSLEISAELDFIGEGKNADLLRKNMDQVLGVEVPRVFWKYCTPSILAIEYVDGVKINEVEQIKEMGVNTKELGVLLFDAYEKQIFVDGFHHGDPEPNNIYINRRGRIVFLDFGHMGILRPERRELFTKLMFAIFDDDIDDVMKSIEEVSPPIQRKRMDLFKDEIYKALLSSNEDNPNVPENRDLEAVIAAIRKYRVELPMQMILTMDTFLSIDSLAKGLNPDFRMETEVKSHIGELFRKRIIDAVNIRKSGMNLLDSVVNSGEIPGNINSALRTISEGPIRFKLDYDNLDRFSDTVDKATFRMLIATSMIVLATQNVVVVGSPIASIVVYLVAGGIGAYSVYKLLLTGKKPLSY